MYDRCRLLDVGSYVATPPPVGVPDAELAAKRQVLVCMRTHAYSEGEGRYGGRVERERENETEREGDRRERERERERESGV